MNRSTFALFSAAILTIPTACTTTGSFDPAALASLALSTRTDLSTLTSATTVPTAGTANYQGYATTIVKDSLTDTTGRQLFGDAELSADFSATGGTIEGTISNVFAKAGVNQTELLTALFSGDAAALETLIDGYDTTTGSVAIETGTITGDRIAAEVSGTITHDGTAIAFGGTGSGTFAGTDGAGLSFFAETNEGLTLSEDGSTMAGDLAVFGVKQ